jgi:hypothetical protein
MRVAFPLQPHKNSAAAKRRKRSRAPCARRIPVAAGRRDRYFFDVGITAGLVVPAGAPGNPASTGRTAVPPPVRIWPPFAGKPAGLKAGTIILVGMIFS